MQLRMLVALVDEGSVQKAAERVFRTAPAVSMALRKLELELGGSLFDRSHPGDYGLTPAGEVLVRYARRLVALHDEALAAVAETRNGQRGTLRIGTNESISLYLLPQLTQMFRQLYPEVKLEVTCDHSDALLSALRRHRLDVALVACCRSDQDLERDPIMKDELVVIMSPKHPLASKADLHIQELGSQSIIIEGDSSSLHGTVVEAFRRFHTPLNVQVESGAIEAIKRMVEHNVGIGIVPRMCVREEEQAGKLVLRTIQEFREERILWVVRRRDGPQSPASKVFVEVIKSAAQEKSWQSTSGKTQANEG